MKTRLQLFHLPPSVNHIYRHTKKGTFRTEAYNVWANGEGYSVNRQMAGQPRWVKPVFVRAAMRRPKGGSDLDNRLKGIGDLLQALGVISNDRLIHGWTVFWSEDLPEGVSAEITIIPAEAVEKAIPALRSSSRRAA
jgi:Holliday junction resolvase RusA-like endonuclease